MRRRNSLPFDTRRVVLAAVEAALEDDRRTRPRKGLTTGRALAVGAGLFVAGKLVAGPSGRRLRDAAEDRWLDLKDRIADELGLDEEPQPEDDEGVEDEVGYEDDEGCEDDDFDDEGAAAGARRRGGPRRRGGRGRLGGRARAGR